MKNLTLRGLTLVLAASLTPAAFSAVSVNGTQFNKFKLVQLANGDMKLTTTPKAVAPDMADKLIPRLAKADYTLDLTAVNGDASVVTNPLITLVNCTATPSDAACEEVTPPPPPPGQCGTLGQELVFETLNWKSQPGTVKISIGKTDKASKIVTTSSTQYAGAIAVVPTTAQGQVWRRVWISECPGTAPLDQTTSKYNYVNGQIVIETVNKCDVGGTQLQLNWSQEANPSTLTACKLETETEYYINYSNDGCNSSDCPMYRSTGNNGKS
jgi:hypothetical protein